MGEFDLAEADFERAAELGLDDAARYVMLVNRGVMRVRRGRHESAVERLPRRDRASSPASSRRTSTSPRSIRTSGAYDQALDVLDRAIARFPRQAVLYRTRAQVHRLLSHDTKALDDLGRAIAPGAAGRPRAGRRLPGAVR